MALEANARLRDVDGRRFGEARLADIAEYLGEYERAAEHRREAYEWLEEQGLLGYVSTFAPQLGRDLCILGRFEEAERLATRGRELALTEDVTAQALWRQVLARVHANRGEHAKAEALAREAVQIVERTDGLEMQGDALCDLAEALQAANRTAEAEAALRDALERYERKRILPRARQVRELLAELPERARP